MRARTKLREYRRKRDFSKTPEPSGTAEKDRRAGLQFVVQKHAARHLHFDLRLELGGVMKSWAVPKGPSMEPSIKRLAVEVEDHPMEYNDFEGTIPEGEYGGGTVMLWDHGTYEPEEVKRGEDPEKAIRRGYHRGKLSFVLHGDRLQGSFALVRTGRGKEGEKPHWLLIKHDDAFAEAGDEEIEEASTSVATGRTMEEIAAGKGTRRSWRSNRAKPRMKSSAADPAAFSPMLCRVAETLPEGDGWTFEPKYDGIRVLAFVTADAVSLVTRNGNEKARQFPDVVAALKALAEQLAIPVVLDGEIVALNEAGGYLRFESLQGRMHLTDARAIRRGAEQSPAGFVAFDLLLAGDEILVKEPWSTRRPRLEALLKGKTGTAIRLAESSPHGSEMLRRAERDDWEGVVAKRTQSPYRPGKRSDDWRKIKVENLQEFVVGGWTEPRGARAHLGALLLGYYSEDGAFTYAGHTGTGFTKQGLAEMHGRLKCIERKTPPFRETPKTNEVAHWTTPKVVVEIKFNEWTRDGHLRQPVFLGVRQDKDPKEVIREPTSMQSEQPARKPGGRSRGMGRASAQDSTSMHAPLVKRIRALQRKGEDGELSLGRGSSLALTSLNKVFYPEAQYTKGDLLAYYAAMADHILPWMLDRPLVLKRFPNGIEGESFYQQAAPEEVPEGVRVEAVQLREEKKPKPKLIGGNLATLLYSVQLGAISYDPWHSRVDHLDSADYTILDLDPGPGAAFQRVVEVARWVQEEMDAFGLHGGLKTSGSRGIHVYLPLPADTPLDAATLISQILATRVVKKHPKEATIERSRKNRPRGAVYVDYLQNILGKTVAGVYAARAKPGATVSTPLAWDELSDDLDLRDFTIDSVPARVRRIGDLWAPAMGVPNALDALLADGGG